jgi:predicted amidophosphoribosyltransferase
MSQFGQASQNFCPQCSAPLDKPAVERRVCPQCGKSFEQAATAPRTLSMETTGNLLDVKTAQRTQEET